MGVLPSFDDKTKFAIAVTGAKLVVSGDGQINAKEKMLIDTVFGQFWKGSMEQVYELLGAAITESDYELVKSVIQMGDAVAFPSAPSSGHKKNEIRQPRLDFVILWADLITIPLFHINLHLHISLTFAVGLVRRSLHALRLVGMTALFGQ